MRVLVDEGGSVSERVAVREEGREGGREIYTLIFFSTPIFYLLPLSVAVAVAVALTVALTVSVKKNTITTS